MKTLDEVISELSPEQRAQVQARGRELIEEERVLQMIARQLDKGCTWADEAMPHEQCPDMSIAVLRKHIEALGGTLELVFRHPDGRCSVLTGFG